MRSGDSLVLLATFLLTVFVNLTIAVPIGLGLAMISFIKRMSDALAVEQVTPDTHVARREDGKEIFFCPQIMTFTIHGPLFFGAADRFEEMLSKSLLQQPKVLILKMRHVSLIDVTGVTNLTGVVLDFQNKGGTVLISEIEGEPLETLQSSGLSVVIGPEHFFETTTEAINHALTLIDPEACAICGKEGFDTCQTYYHIDTVQTSKDQN